MRYPEAQWLGNGQSGGSYTGGPFRLVIHTTETSGLPDYNDGRSAPHITYDPEFRNFYQHTDFATAARALRNEAGGVQTNRRSALQIEIICYSARSIADQTLSRQWVGDLSDDNYEDLRTFVSWCGTAYGVAMKWPGRQALSYSQANAAGFRMTGAQWNEYDGVIGHQHVPENTHWDPGAINWTKLLPSEDDMSKQDALDALNEFFGASRRVNDPQGMTNPDGTPRTRLYVDALVDSTWHPVSGTLPGKNPAKTIDYQTRPLELSEAELDDIAAQVVAAVTPGIRAAVAAELAELKLKPF